MSQAKLSKRIVINPKICHGKPVIRGTRMPVAYIIGSLAGGMSMEEIQKEYAVTSRDIQAALQFAASLVEEEQFHALPH